MSENLVKDRECIHCENFYDCNGKPRDMKHKPCVQYVERVEVPQKTLWERLTEPEKKEGGNDGRKKNVHKEDN